MDYETMLAGRVNTAKRGGRPTGLSKALQSMSPGDVIDVTDLSTSANPMVIRINASLAAARTFGPRRATTRIKDGRVYVARLKDEDVRP